MEYLVGEKKYNLSYSDLRERYHEFCNLSDDEFKSRLSEILHFACIVSYLKELPNECTVSDEGIIHEISHLMCFIHTFGELKLVREKFGKLLRLD